MLAVEFDAFVALESDGLLPAESDVLGVSDVLAAGERAVDDGGEEVVEDEVLEGVEPVVGGVEEFGMVEGDDGDGEDEGAPVAGVAAGFDSSLSASPPGRRCSTGRSSFPPSSITGGEYLCVSVLGFAPSGSHVPSAIHS